AHDRDPGGPWAAASLYRMAELYLGLYKRSIRTSDKEEAIGLLRRIVENFPRSRHHAGASKKLAALTPGRPPAPRPAPPPETPVPGGKRKVTKLRFWSNPSYTRVVIDVDGKTSFRHNRLKKDPAHDKPQRVYVDLRECGLSKEIKRTTVVDDNLLSDIRANYYTADTVRVVVDIKTFETYKVFSLRNPFRVVIDVWGKTAKKPPPPAAAARPESKDDLPPGALTRQLALGVSRIIIDPGHGGKDHGAPGYFKGVREKDVALAIGKKLADRITKQLKCEVIMTRTRDKFLSLEERTAMANTKNGDLFISIHTNAHRNRGAHGIETYFLNLATDDEAILVAARENATSAKNISDLESILNDLMQNAKINESSRLATHIQDSLYGNLRKKYKYVKSKGVKQAPFYVLLGAQMPAVLIETSFISNKRECKRLTNPKYQNHLCDGIIKGIRKYIDETSPSAFSSSYTADNGEG
ncbi:MAG: AMIN domain-containing protein, partial [Desulfobacterales bacterium]|nr:AMIN domain-containing protein [Desulfobacterales bacterium]